LGTRRQAFGLWLAPLSFFWSVDRDRLKLLANACRDWEAGRNLEEAAKIMFGTPNPKGLERMVKARRDQIASQGKTDRGKARQGKKKAQSIDVEGLGKLNHDGDEFVVKKKTLLYPKTAIAVCVEPELATSDAVGKLWSKFCQREKTLLRELESSIAKYYRQIRERPGTGGMDPMPPLKRNAEVWKTLGKPEITFRKRGRQVEMEVSWCPDWEEEHGMYVYISREAKIRHVGEFE
jgi:hypothetical protein